MARNQLGTEPLLDAMAVYQTELAKGTSAQQFKYIQRLVKDLSDINRQDKSGLTFLIVAVRQFKADIVQLLLENGADPNICDHLGVYPLAYAFLKYVPDTEPIIRLLLRYGADPALGKTPRHTAFYYAEVTQAAPHLVELLEEANSRLHGEGG